MTTGVGAEGDPPAEDHAQLLEQARMVEHTFDAIIVRDAEDRIVRWNRGASDLYGWTREEAVGQVTHALLRTVFPKPFSEIVVDLARDGAWEGELVHTSKSGRPVTVLSRWVLERDRHGRQRFVLETNKDITLRRAAEDEMHALNRQLRQRVEALDTLLKILPVGVWIGNADCSEITGNPTAYRIMGFAEGINVSVTSSEPQVPAGLRIFVDGQEVRPEDAPMQRVARTGRALDNFEHELRFPDGRTAAIYGSVAPLFDEQGRVRQVIAAYADYTERKRAEAGIDAERRLLQAVLAGSDDGFTVQDSTGKLVFANASAARLVGFSSPEAMLAAPLSDLFRKFEMSREDGTPLAPDDLPGRAVLTGRPADPIVVQYRVTGTGERRWSHVRAYPVLGADGKLARVVNVFRDVTDEHREAAQRRLLLTAVGRFNESLDYGATLRAIAREMVPGLADWCAVDILEGDELRRLAAEHIDPAKISLVQEIERRYPADPRRPGSPRTVIESGKPFLLPNIPDEMIRAAARDAEHLELIERLRLRSFLVVPMIGRGGPVGALTLAMAESGRLYSEDDVAFVSALADRAASAIENARLVRALESTVAAERRARDLMERSQAVIAAMAQAKTPDDVAEAACRIGGQAMGAYAAHLWLAKADGSLSLAGGWPAGTESLADSFRRIAPGASAPAARVARSGEVEWIETEEAFERAAPDIYAAAKAAGRVAAFAAIPIPGAQSPIGVLSIAHRSPHTYGADERAFYLSLAQFCAQSLERARLFEEERVAREQAEQAASLSEMLVGMVSHDLRNPLNAISTSAQLVHTTATDDRQRRLGARIARSARRMARMIDQLLDFTRIRTGHGVPIEPTVMNFAELARQIIEETEAAHGCTINLACSGDTVGSWDDDRLAQVLSNLLSNAALHGRSGSTIWIQVEGQGQEAIEVSIRNDGQVPDEILPHIFEPFRGTGYMSGVARGLGLGLYITRALVSAHGGTIDVNTDEAGTVFRIRLPREARGTVRES